MYFKLPGRIFVKFLLWLNQMSACVFSLENAHWSINGSLTSEGYREHIITGSWNSMRIYLPQLWCLRTDFENCRSGSVSQIPIKFLHCESHYSGDAGGQAEFPTQKQISSIMQWRVLYISKLAGNRELKLFQTVVGSKRLSVLITLCVWCSAFSQQLECCSLSVID